MSHQKRPDVFHQIDYFDGWGYFGAVLIGGFVYEVDSRGKGAYKQEGAIPVIVRTGPFVPPFSCSAGGGYSVTDEFKRRMESSGLKGLAFRKLKKKRIVRFHWEDWDKDRYWGEYWDIEDKDPEEFLMYSRH